MSPPVPQNPPTNPALTEGTFDARDLAKLLKCSERHVRRLTDLNQVPGLIRCGRLVRFHRGTVLDWLRAGCPTPAAR